MTISYNWLSDYLPERIDPDKLSKILTSVGLEVESMEAFDEVRGGLEGLIIGQVLQADKHPNADKLKLTKVDIGNGSPLQIVCGAPNVAAGQKVVVATIGTTIYPTSGDPLTMKTANIRGVESQGMICAEDEIGLGTSHAGIMVLPPDVPVGTSAARYFNPYHDTIYEIGLTPNRMDAMSHWGVARDVCAYLSHHEKKELRPVVPQISFKVDSNSLPIKISIENPKACKRYSGVCLAGVQIKESPEWLQQKLKAIGVRPINNIVDITNFIQHETGQPLHAFDYDAIKDRQIIVKTLPSGTTFTTLDEKKRKLNEEDLMICDPQGPMCFAGVFGGLHSGVKPDTTNIFLESAWFDPVYVRKTSFRHGLRTDAAMRFEKGIDISNTVNVLKRAAALMRELSGCSIASDIVDVYPDPQPKKEVTLKYHYLKKLSGKNYHPDTLKNILESLGFAVARDHVDSLTLEVPYHKPDVSIPADIVEEIVRIDGLDNIEIPTAISISPSIETNYRSEQLKEKISNVLTGISFSEILTNSITNSAHLKDEDKRHVVKLLNNLSVELDVLRPSMLYTALEIIAFNMNRKNADMRLFEFGKTYSTSGVGKYAETNHLCLYVTGNISEDSWKRKDQKSDIYFLKGVVEAVLNVLGIDEAQFSAMEDADIAEALQVKANKLVVAQLGAVRPDLLNKFGIKQDVYFADFNWDNVLETGAKKIQFNEIPRFPSVERDLAMIVPRAMEYHQIRDQINRLKLNNLQRIRLFDVFESERLGKDKKSIAINLTFLDEGKTLTDKEIDSWMTKVMTTLEKELNAEIRKQ